MEREIQRAALRATAKVALSLTVFGCGATVEVVPAPEKKTPDTKARPPATTNLGGHGGARPIGANGGAGAMATGGAGGTSNAVCGAPELGTPVSVDPDQFGCCLEVLDASPPFVDPTDDVVSCCNVIVGQIDLEPSLLETVNPDYLAQTFPENDSPSCCDVLGNPCSFPCGCTVWGPPMPTAVVGRLRSLAELEVA